MKSKILFLSIFAVLFAACNNESDTLMPEDMKVQATFYTNLESGTSSSYFGTKTDVDRPDSAPVEITGITITADNTKLEGDWLQDANGAWYQTAYPDVVETFTFETVDDGTPEPITMEVGVGNTIFTAVSTTNSTAGVFYEPDFAAKQSGDLITRAQNYTGDLQTAQAIYVEYATQVYRNVQFNTNWFDNIVANGYSLAGVPAGLTLEELLVVRDVRNDLLEFWYSGYFALWPGYVDLHLSPRTGRTQIVFDSEVDLQFQITAVLYDDNDTPDDDSDDVILDDQKDANGNQISLSHSVLANASAIIFNTADMVDGTYVQVTVEKRATDADPWTEVPTDINIPTQAGHNVTGVINFTDEAVVNASLSLTYTPEFSDVNGGREITD